MTRHLCFQALQEPYDLGQLDDEGRALCVFNVVAYKRPSDTLLQEVVAILTAAAVGTEGVDIFASSLATIPRGAGPFLSLKSGGGAGSVGTHNHGAGAYRRPSLQILVRAATWEAAEAMAQRAYDALIGVRNQEVSA